MKKVPSCSALGLEHAGGGGVLGLRGRWWCKIKRLLVFLSLVLFSFCPRNLSVVVLRENSVIGLAYQPVTPRGEDKYRQLKFKLVCTCLWHSFLSLSLYRLLLSLSLSLLCRSVYNFASAQCHMPGHTTFTHAHSSAEMNRWGPVTVGDWLEDISAFDFISGALLIIQYWHGIALQISRYV